MYVARCPCGALTAECDGEPVKVSVCHCLDCQRRSGSAFAAQARFAEADVRIAGPIQAYCRTGENGLATFHFCPGCGGTIAYRTESVPGLWAIPLGTFAQPDFPPPAYSVFEERKQPWVEIVGDDIDHIE